ncbi:MAG: hypothetical protein QW238_04890 [Candidatus Bathyarchaeia archaeon]
MVVRVRVKPVSGGAEVTAAVIANSGFESEEPEVMVPEGVAERLGLHPRLPRV